MKSLTLTFLTCWCALTAAGAQTTWYIDGAAATSGNGSQGAPFQTVAEGLSAATSGDTVLVAPATYFENDLDFAGKNVDVVGTAGANTTLLDAQYLGRALLFTSGESPAARVRGFTIRRGASPDGANAGPGAPGAPGTLGGAVLIDGASPTFEDCFFESNRAGEGGRGGIYPTPPTATDRSGGLGGSGGAVSSRFGSPRFVRCRFVNNEAGAGGMGAMPLVLCASPIAAAPYMCHGSAGGAGGIGGAVSLVGGSARFEACEFFNNRAGAGGESSRISLSPSSEGGWGGALSLIGGQVTLVGCTLANNQAGAGGKGGDWTGYTISGDDSEGELGGPGGNGGALATYSGHVDLIGCVVYGNAAGAGGAHGLPDCSATTGACTTSGPGGDGGAVYAAAQTAPHFASHCIFWDNVAGAGGPTTGAAHVGASGADPLFSGAVNASWCNLSTAYPGVGNLSAPPEFRDAAMGDFHLLPTSPCVDAGDVASVLLPPTDFEGEPRVFGTAPDLGVDEVVLRVFVQQPGGAGTPVFVEHRNLITGNEYSTLFSLTPCPTFGTGAFLGLCAPDLAAQNLLLAQFLAPLGTPPFHFLATAADSLVGPFNSLPVAVEAVTFDFTGSQFGNVSPVTAFTVN